MKYEHIIYIHQQVVWLLKFQLNIVEHNLIFWLRTEFKIQASYYN